MYDCSQCEKTPAYLQLLGHDGPPTGLWQENLVTKAPLERCPLRTILLASPESRAELRRYVDSYLPAYRDGFLLVHGGLADQPARYVELIQLGRRLERQVDAKYLEVRSSEGGDGDT